MAFSSRRDFIRQTVLATVAGSSASAWLPARAEPRKNEPVILGHNGFRYRVVPGWGVLDAGKNPVNDCHEMVQDAKGRIILLTNETKNNVLMYDKSGKLLGTWGHDYPGGHGLTIGGEGNEQYLIICDTDRHQVIKTDLNGRELMKIDYPRETGTYAYPTQFKPTESAINPANGDIYVVDGYGLNYVTQYDSSGKLIRQFGGGGQGDANFDCCHGIVVDRRQATPTLIITDRRRNALKRFTLDGKYLSTIALPGSFICRPVIHGDHLYGAVYRSTSEQYAESGYVQILDKNDKVVSTPGGSEPVYQAGKLMEQRKELAGSPFLHPHDVLVDEDENLYVAQWSSKKTYPVKLERVG
ncbi:6-bladed beta-propeller [Spirosoma sp. KUDC1026]|uniref:6-bladed beta-propeller n=1 Tax=Spirosoma sp. KUDC1026 TaxID=2745947 RepID=UPI00159BA720|nr:6-bladed beta-propeller [Spirosoma sp. KUDC1026]QKZ12124.1 6-bladed beta-propeller [Spirosoma sp. KUDC1026]